MDYISASQYSTKKKIFRHQIVIGAVFFQHYWPYLVVVDVEPLFTEGKKKIIVKRSYIILHLFLGCDFQFKLTSSCSSDNGTSATWDAAVLCSFTAIETPFSPRLLPNHSSTYRHTVVYFLLQVSQKHL